MSETTGAKSDLRSLMRILSDYQRNGAIIKKIGKKKTGFPVQFESLFDDYILKREQDQLTKNSIQMESLHLKYWGSYLDQRESFFGRQP